ncbi:MAG TPA: DUF2279 domain-containing protein [Thermoanaerobaculia bacterium]|nr:DUF2279 domain-containing protein [Thermoanaerobaculia bacterium]
MILAVSLFALAGRVAADDSYAVFASDVPPEYYFEPNRGGSSRTFDPKLSWSTGGAPDTPAIEVTESAQVRLPPNPTGVRAVVPKTPSRLGLTLVTAGVLVGSAVSALDVGHAREGFHFANERWFQEDTYAGGDDKASHFVFYNGLSRQLGVALQNMGYEKDRAITMSFLTAMAAGLIVEIGDGLTIYGFSWEDFTMDTLGAGTAALITHFNLDDTVGFSFGKVDAEQPPPCCRTAGVGKDYSTEIYYADLKLAGFARRLNVRPGPARFLLFSVSYGSKGYRYSPLALRQRNIGLDIGLNIPEIMSAVGVPENKWWGRLLYGFFNFFRVPFTTVGIYYDFNHGKWHGPDAGNVYDPGP